MASMQRTIARNIARERMTTAGIKRVNLKGYSVSPKSNIKRSKAFKETLTSFFALNWRAFLGKPVKSNKRTPREFKPRSRLAKLLGV